MNLLTLQVGTNLTDLLLQKKITIRELGGCMGPIWASYYGDCRAVLVSPRPANPSSNRALVGGHLLAPDQRFPASVASRCSWQSGRPGADCPAPQPLGQRRAVVVASREVRQGPPRGAARKDLARTTLHPGAGQGRVEPGSRASLSAACYCAVVCVQEQALDEGTAGV